MVKDSQASVAQKEICEAPNLEVFCSNPVSSLVSTFLISIFRAASGSFLACVCEVQLRLCV